MQFVRVTIFYISVFYSYKNHLHTKHTIKLAFSEPHAHTHKHTYTNKHTFLCIPRTSPTYNTHFHPLQHHIKGDFYPLHTKLQHPKDITYSEKLGL